MLEHHRPSPYQFVQFVEYICVFRCTIYIWLKYCYLDHIIRWLCVLHKTDETDFNFRTFLSFFCCCFFSFLFSIWPRKPKIIRPHHFQIKYSIVLFLCSWHKIKEKVVGFFFTSLDCNLQLTIAATIVWFMKWKKFIKQNDEKIASCIHDADHIQLVLSGVQVWKQKFGKTSSRSNTLKF